MKWLKNSSQKTKSWWTRSLYLSLAISLMEGILVGAVPKTYAASLTPGPRVSFTFDDALVSSLTQAAPTLAKYGFVGTDFVPTGCVGTSGTCPAEPSHVYMSWDQVTQLKNTYGWEIASHTVNHPLLASTDPSTQPQALTPAQVDNELTTSKLTLGNNGITATDFATPYGDWTPPVLAQIARVMLRTAVFRILSTRLEPVLSTTVILSPTTIIYFMICRCRRA